MAHEWLRPDAASSTLECTVGRKPLGIQKDGCTLRPRRCTLDRRARRMAAARAGSLRGPRGRSFRAPLVPLRPESRARWPLPNPGPDQEHIAPSRRPPARPQSDWGELRCSRSARHGRLLIGGAPREPFAAGGRQRTVQRLGQGLRQRRHWPSMPKTASSTAPTTSSSTSRARGGCRGDTQGAERRQAGEGQSPRDPGPRDTVTGGLARLTMPRPRLSSPPLSGEANGAKMMAGTANPTVIPHLGASGRNAAVSSSRIQARHPGPLARLRPGAPRESEARRRSRRSRPLGHQRPVSSARRAARAQASPGTRGWRGPAHGTWLRAKSWPGSPS